MIKGIPQFNVVQKVLTRVFYSPNDSIIIFTEDKPSDRLLYSLLFNRLLKDQCKISLVKPLGPKSTVIEQSILSSKSKNNSIFIVDSDIKIMLDETLETDNLISLRRYCIENYLCCETGIIEYLHIKLGIERSKIKDDLDFDKLIIKNGKLLIKLYYRLLLSFQLSCGCGFKSVTNFLSRPDRYSDVVPALINAEIREVETSIKLKLKHSGYRSFRKEMDLRIEEIALKNPANIDRILTVLSGKDQLLPLIKLKINSLDSSSRLLNSDQLKRLLAERVDLAPLSFLKEKIRSILS